MAEKWLFWLEEICAGHNDLVGKKCANLGELTRAGFRVPPGFALSLDAYKRFMHETGAIEDIRQYLRDFEADPNNMAHTERFEEAARVIRAMVEAKEMPSDMEEGIKKYYRELCERTGTDNLSVSTRSAGPVSHPGQYETYLHVKGADEVVQNVKKVWSSTFNARSLIARARLNLPLEYDPIGVAVLTMVNAKAAGVMFTLDPSNGDTSKVVIEGSWGLGEAVVSGSVTPDRYKVNKVTLDIEERTVSYKSVEFAYNPDKRAMEYKELPAELATKPSLEDEEILELTKVAKMVEEHYGCPQDIEWCISRDFAFPENVFLVQARPETVWSKKKQVAIGKKTGFDLLFERAMAKTKVS